MTKEKELKLRLLQLDRINIVNCLHTGYELLLYEVYKDNIKRDVEKKYKCQI